MSVSMRKIKIKDMDKREHINKIIEAYDGTGCYQAVDAILDLFEEDRPAQTGRLEVDIEVEDHQTGCVGKLRPAHGTELALN